MSTTSVKAAKDIPLTLEEAVKSVKDRKAIESLVGQLAEMRETRKQMEQDEKDAKTGLIGYAEQYGFNALHVGQLKATVDTQSRDSLNRDLLIEHLEKLKLTARQIRECLAAATKTSTFAVVRVTDIPKSELGGRYD